MTSSLRRKTYKALIQNDAGLTGRVLNRSIAALIIINVIALMVETVEPIGREYALLFRVVEYVSITIFLAEYLTRLWCIVEDAEYSRPISGRLRYAVSPLAIIDLVAILPGLLPFIAADLRVLRLARILRIARIAKLGRYSRSVRAMGNVLSSTWRDLVVVGGVLSLILCVAATLMYHAEHDVQPDAFPSLPATLWWAIATLTTIGYGDVYPVTATGKVLSSIVAVLGIGFIALPTGILSAAYLDEVRRLRSRPS